MLFKKAHELQTFFSNQGLDLIYYVGTIVLGPRVKPALHRKKSTTWPAEKVTYIGTYISSTTYTSVICSYIMAIKQTSNYEKLFNIIFHMLPLINSGTSEKCFGVVCIPDNYSKSVPPFQKDSVLNIDVDFLQIKILNINDFQSSVTLLLKLWLSWNDPRLIIHPTANELIMVGISNYCN